MASSILQKKNRRSFQHRPMHDINITPFVDVMLVLLVVFMITAPLLTQGVQVNLPEVENSPIKDNKEPIQISVKNNGDVYLQTRKVAPTELVVKLKAIRKVRGNVTILLNADKNINYGRVMEVMSALQTVGLVDVGLVTQPTVRAR